MPLILGTNSIKDTTFDVERSLRFDRTSSERLHFTQGSGDDTTARRKWTFSTWIKRGQLVNSSNHQYFFGVGTYTLIGFRLDGSGEADDMYIQVGTGSSAQGLHTNAKFRDPSAWMHVYVAFDSTDGTAANRIKAYINGNLIDNAYGDYSMDQRSSITQNDEDDFVGNSGDVINIGYSTNGTNSYFDGYMAETHLLIGTTKAHTEFAESNNDGIWIPKETNFSTSDYGSNGFKLEYKQTGTSANSSGLGADTSGNNNHFTVSNHTSIDQCADTPTNNYATLNFIDNYYTPHSLSNGNLKQTTDSTSGYAPNVSTIALSQGKWYFEVKYVSRSSSDNYNLIGIRGSQITNTNYLGQNQYEYGYYSQSGKYYTNNSAVTYGDSYDQGDIIGCYLDLDNNKLYFAKNGTIQNSGTGISITDPASTPLGHYFFAVGDYGQSLTIVNEINFGNPTFTISSGNADPDSHGNFEYSPNDGGSSSFDSSAKNFYALNTKNLAEYG